MAGDVKVAIVSGLISSSGTGTADFTKAGFGTPKACIVLLSFDTADDTAVAIQSKASIGFSDFTNHRCIIHQDEDGSAKVDSDARKSASQVYVSLDIAGNIDIRGRASTITDGVRLTNQGNSSGSAVFATVIMLGGADLQVSLDSVALGNGVDLTTVVTTGIRQRMVFFIGVDLAGEDSSGTAVNNSFGVVDISNDQATLVNRCMGWTSDHNNNVGAPASVMRNDRCLKILTEAAGDDWGIELTAATPTSYTITTRDVSPGAGMEVYALALDLDDRGSKVGSVDSPTAGATWTPLVALGFTPQYVGLGVTHAAVEGTIEADADAGGLGISSNTGTGEEAFHGWYNEDASAVTNTNNNFRSRVIDFRNDDVTVVVQDHSHLSFNSGGWTYTINAENETAAKKWFYWAIEEGAVPAVAVSAKASAASTGKAAISVFRAITAAGIAGAIGLSSIGTLRSVAETGVASSTGKATVTIGVATTQHPATGVAGSVGKVSIEVRRAIAATGTAAATAHVSVLNKNAISATGVAGATGKAAVFNKNRVAATGVAGSTGTVNVSPKRPFAATASGSSLGKASLEVRRAIAATAAAGATGKTTINVVAGAVAVITGRASGSSLGTVQLEVRLPIAGTAAGASTGQAQLQALRSIAGTGTASATGKATLNVLVGGVAVIAAKGTAAATGTAVLEAKRAIAGSGPAGSTGTTSLEVRRAVAARSAGGSTGTVNVSPKLVVAARGAGASTGKASVEVRHELPATAAGSSVGKVSIGVLRSITARGAGASTGHAIAAPFLGLAIRATGVASSVGRAKVVRIPGTLFDLAMWFGIKREGPTFNAVKLTSPTFTNVHLEE